MIVFLTKGGILNPSLLETKSVPRRVLSLGMLVLPRTAPWRAVFWRAVLEHPLARYTVALSPFLVALFLFPHLALPIAEAPLLMFLTIWLFERYVLSISDPKARRALISEDEAGRVLDGLRVAAEAALTRIAAARGLEAGTLHLVVEQSAYARVPPLTLVSVLHEGDRVRVLDLDAGERRAIGAALFSEPGTERALHRANLADGEQIRRFALEPGTISAHARLAALAARGGGALSQAVPA
ncbi:MAG: hypothetical protein QNJ13_03575 [Paracoccaceae bacterium]|nr:hypothetical protein [Paracoccaceae bacterium]